MRSLSAIHMTLSHSGGAHRDVKPDNMLVRLSAESMHLRLIDFGSALDEFVITHLYGQAGPSVQQQTPEYAPPEALLGR